MSTTYRLRALDKLFIKDGRPLSLEDDSAASGLFPPPPSVLYGALRSAVLAQAGAAPGSQQDPVHGGLLTGIAFSKSTDDQNHQLYFPAPNDLVRQKTKDEEERRQLPAYRLLLTSTDEAALTNYPVTGGQLLQSTLRQPVTSVQGYVSARGLADYLNHREVKAVDILDASALYQAEPKLGIGLDYDSGTTKHGLLYTMAMQRLCDGITLCVRTKDFGPLTPLLRLGAESRAAEVIEAPRTEWPSAVLPDNDRFTLYLSTPAVFKQGWLPDFLDAKSMSGTIGGAEVRLLAASVGAYLPLGGWDIAARRPKPMRRAVNAGAVYHFAITNGELQPDIIHNHPLMTAYAHSGLREGTNELTYQQQGFGIAYLGQGPQDHTLSNIS